MSFAAANGHVSRIISDRTEGVSQNLPICVHSMLTGLILRSVRRLTCGQLTYMLPMLDYGLTIY